MERLLPNLEPETYRSWTKALAIALSATSLKAPRHIIVSLKARFGNTLLLFYIQKIFRNLN
ncbi:hypothetical protein DVH24_032423 [Malus domestica]|uniref:Uncharacterized protein n=1 Tax=Malus domestica TaxID=3750 RepID=A0A498J4D3_MALDO|nr:hypothetical protein DVH24_032423 [Malus domestica]